MQAQHGAKRGPSSIYFGAEKCCTYQPRIHNFLAGRILAETDTSMRRAREILEEMITRRSGATPMGVYGPRTYWLHYEAVSAAFGRSSALRCLFFDPSSGDCGIWPHREATCATWFCKHNRGQKGKLFWESLRDLLIAMERALARTLILEMDPGAEALKLAFSQYGEPYEPEELVGSTSDALHSRHWGSWAGREREFFLECARRADGMALEEVLSLGGVETRALARLVLEQFRALKAPAQPDAPLRLGHFEIIQLLDDHAQISTYSGYDLLEVPRSLLGALVRFDGRPTASVLEEIKQCDGLVISSETLDTLCDFGVLGAGKP
jgi:Fe-S-cluster containining protein